MSKPDAPEATNPLPSLYLGQAFNSPNQYTPFGNLINTPPQLPTGTTIDNFNQTPLNQIQAGTTSVQLPQAIQDIFDTQSGITQESLNQAWYNLLDFGNTDFDTQSINPDDFQFGGAINPSDFQFDGAINPDNFQFGGALNPNDFQFSGAMNPNDFQFGGAMNPDDFQFSGPTNQDYEALRQEATQGEFDRLMNLLNPEFDQQGQQLRESLASRGLPVERGSGTGQTSLSNAAGTELGRFQNRRNQATEQAGLSALGAGRQEAALGMRANQQLYDQLFQQTMGNLGVQQAAFNQAFQQNQGNIGLQNDAFNQAFQQNLGNLGVQQSAFDQGFQQNQGNIGLQNNAFNQGFQQNQGNIGLQNNAFDQGFRQNQGNIGLQQTALQQNLGNQAFLQNQIAGPLGFQQIAPPQLSNFFAPSQQDVLGGMGQYDASNQSAFQSQMNQLASLFGAGGSALGGFLGNTSLFGGG